MPRKKKHRKRGKNKHRQRQMNNKQRQNKTKSDLTNLLDDRTMSTTLLSSNAAGYSTPVCDTKFRNDSFEMETPIRRIPLMNLRNPRRKSRCQDPLADDIPVKTTPVNKRRSLNRQKETNLNNTWNVTNLNALFDSDIFKQNGDVSLGSDVNKSKQRSRSSIPKLHSPFQEKEYKLADENELEQEKHDIITETPRVTQEILADIDMSKIQVPFELNNSKNRQNQKTKFIKTNEININPYLKEKQILNIEVETQIAKWRKGDSVEELAFFSPQLFDGKSSSTPIQGLLNDLKEDVLKENLDMVSNSKLGFISKIEVTPLRDAITKTPRSKKLGDQVLNNSKDLAWQLENVNVNTPPLNEKILDKDKSNSIKLLGSNKRRNGISRIQNRTSPKISRLINHSPMFAKNVSHSRVSTNRRVSLDYHSYEPRSNMVQMGMCERIMNKIKRYSKESAKWSSKMMEACSHLGIQIKNSLASLCNMYEGSRLDCSQKSCNCSTYKAEITNLNVKMEGLTGELSYLRRQIEEYNYGQKSREESIEKLREELVKQLSTNFTDIRSELTCLKDQLQCFKNAAPISIGSQPVAFAPPPPPPPPPPMPPMQAVPPKPLLGRKSKTAFGFGTENSDKGDARPVISLDEILKVKLKKASERRTTTVSGQSHLSSDSIVHDDFLHQIKLRRTRGGSATPNLTSLSTPGGASTTSSDLSTSPASSLNRLLDSGSEIAGQVVVRCDGKEGQCW